MIKIRSAIAVLASLLSLSAQSHANENADEVVLQLIQESLQQPESEVSVELIAADKALAECLEPSFALPYSVNEYGGRTTISFTCTGNDRQRFMQANVKVITPYWTPNRDISSGEVIEQSMLQQESGERAKLPRNLITHLDEIVGKQANRSLREGAAVQSSSVQASIVVKRNSVVEVEAAGLGYRIKRDGKAMDNGAVGDMVRVRLKGGETIQAIVIANNRLKVDI